MRFIVGGGGHGLATAYYLAKVHGMTDIAVVEKGWIVPGSLSVCNDSHACSGGSVGALAQEILSSPEEYYVNVHNGEYPGGALRGQLAFQD